MKKKAIILLTAALLLFCAVFLYCRTESAVDRYSRYILKNTVHSRVNDCINAFFSENEELFASVCKYSYTESGSISTITLDSVAVNKVRAGLEKTIVGEIEKLKSESFYMPFGNAIGSRLLSDRGPRIKIKIVPLGTVECETINSFSSVGINHTLHRVGLSFKACFSGAPPFGGVVYETEFYVALCENIIAGEVPNVYFN